MDQRRADPLAAHARECVECETTPLPLQRIAAALDAAAVPIDATALSQRVHRRLRAELSVRAAAAFRRRVIVGLALSLLPLAAVVLYDAMVLQLAYTLARDVLPQAVATYLVATYAAFLVLLFALTYAAVPVVLMRPRRLAAG